MRGRWEDQPAPWCWKRRARGVRAAAPASRASPRRPAAGMLLLRVAACGVCRTDLQLCEGDLAMHRPPIVPGHQIVGRVEAVGAGVAGWRAGDRAGVAWLAGTGGTCDKCRSGRENLCARATFTGWDVDGGYATHATVRADFALRMPDGFDDLAAAPLLCGGVIGYRSLKRSGIAAGRPPRALRLRRLGPDRAADRAALGLPHLRRDPLARPSGSARWRWAPSGRAATTTAPPEPLDAAITFAPSGDVVRAALRAARSRRAPSPSTPSTSIACPRCPTRSCGGSAGSPASRTSRAPTRREFLALAARIPVRTAFETHPLDDANVALARLSRGEVRGAAVLVP